MSAPSPMPVMTPPDIRREELKARVLDALKQHGTITKASAAAGVTPRTVQRWQNADPAFQQEVQRWMHIDQADDLALTLYEIAHLAKVDSKYANAGVRAAEILLKSLARDEFGDHQTIDQTVNVNQTVQVIHEVRDQMRERQQEKLKQLRTVDMETGPLPALPATK